MSTKIKLKKYYLAICKEKMKYNAVRNAKNVADIASYYPELEQKSHCEKVKENIEWAKKYSEVNEFYTLYGFDIVGLRNQEEYIDNFSFIVTRNKVNKMKESWSYIALLRDKYLFYKYMSSNGFPVPDVFAIIKDNNLYDVLFHILDWDTLKFEKDYFLKDIDGECASFVKHIENHDELASLKEKIKTGSFILQRRVIQNSAMDIINPKSINTLRIITINKDGNPYVLSSLLRVGTAKSGNVDNWAAGGLAIGIDDNAHLKKYGYYKPIYGTKTSVHPDTGVVFTDFQVPMYDEAMNLACEAHRCFYGVRAIGWDIAISDSGPVFIEGNDNFEISLQQACDRPLRGEWLSACN